MIRRRALLLLLAFAAAPIGGCKRPTPATARLAGDAGPRDGGTLRVAVEDEPPTLNPLVEHDAWTLWIALDAIYDPLVRYDPASASFVPALAARFDAPDELSLRFTLRGGVSWHDGRPFTADDVAATLDLVRDPTVGADQRVDFVDLVEVRALTPGEVTLRFARPAPLALQSLAHLPILPAHRIGEPERKDLRAAAISRAPIGTGPFRFVEWRSRDRILLDRNPRYFGAPARVDHLALRMVRDREAAFELFRRGELDLLWRLPPVQVGRPAPDGAVATRWSQPAYSFVVWNLRRPGLGDVRVRRALTMLTDRARYLETAFRGAARPTTGPYPLDSPSYDRTIEPWPFDPARARALLDQAGIRDRDGDGTRELDGKPFKLAFLLNAGSKTLEPLATMMQEDFRRAGIALEIVPTDWASLLKRLRAHDFDAASLQWQMQPIQQNYDVFHSSQAESGQNFGGLRDPDVDALLDELRRTPLGPARIALDHRLHRRIHELQPYTFLGVPAIDSLAAARVGGYRPSSEGLGFARMWLRDAGGEGAAP